MRKVYSWCIVIGLLTGCKDVKDPVAFAQDEQNGLVKSCAFGELIYKVQYKSPAFIVAMENLEPIAAAKRKKQLEGTVWFNVTFKIKDYNQSPLRYQIRGLEEYTQRQDYYLNGAAKDMYMLYGKDTLFANSYWFENNQNLLPYETMVVGFQLPDNQTEPEEDLRFSFYDRVYKNGIIKVIIRKEDLEQLPTM